jgi:hypothetical protein
MTKRPGVNARQVISWTLVVAAGVGAAAGLTVLGVPAAWMIGPLLVAIVAAVIGGVQLRFAPAGFTAAQVVIGCLIAGTVTPPVIGSMLHDWFAMLLVVATTIAAAGITGWLLARFGSLPAETAAWGSSPGGAAAMTAMSADYGADPRLVAFMQYLRVTIVVLSASTVSRLLLPHATAATLPGTFAIDPLGLAETTAVGIAGFLGARQLRIPGAPLLGPMVLGAVLHGVGLIRIDVPLEALAAAYVCIGLTVGLRYTRETVGHALRALPQLLLSTLVLIALCGGSAVLLVATIHVDPLTAYLATTPGGLDSVTAIAIGSGADVPLVLAIQALRLFAVIVAGPLVAKVIARTA